MSCYCSCRLTGCLKLNCSFSPIITESLAHRNINCGKPYVFMVCVYVCLFQSTNEAVLGVDFSPTDTNNIISCGKSHVYFWTLSAGTLTKKQGIFGVSPYLLSSTVNLVSFPFPCTEMGRNYVN